LKPQNPVTKTIYTFITLNFDSLLPQNLNPLTNIHRPIDKCSSIVWSGIWSPWPINLEFWPQQGRSPREKNVFQSITWVLSIRIEYFMTCLKDLRGLFEIRTNVLMPSAPVAYSSNRPKCLYIDQKLFTDGETHWPQFWTSTIHWALAIIWPKFQNSNTGLDSALSPINNTSQRKSVKTDRQFWFHEQDLILIFFQTGRGF
jgi:hypothetical protein